MTEYWQTKKLPKNLIVLCNTNSQKNNEEYGTVGNHSKISAIHNQIEEQEIRPVIEILTGMKELGLTKILMPGEYDPEDIIKVISRESPIIEFKGKLFVLPRNDPENETLKKLKKELGIDQ